MAQTDLQHTLLIFLPPEGLTAEKLTRFVRRLHDHEATSPSSPQGAELDAFVAKRHAHPLSSMVAVEWAWGPFDRTSVFYENVWHLQTLDASGRPNPPPRTGVPGRPAMPALLRAAGRQ